jgi:hypothetical protein
MEKDFQKDISINRFKLDQECEEQPSNYMYWSEKLIEVKSELDVLMARLKYIYAEKDIFYRNNPQAGIKVTEASVGSMVETDKDIQNLKTKINTVQSKVYTFSAAVSALDHKKSQLKNLTELWIAGYYSDPNRHKTPADDQQNELRRKLNQKGE